MAPIIFPEYQQQSQASFVPDGQHIIQQTTTFLQKLVLQN